jgi:hypothetical protein
MTRTAGTETTLTPREYLKQADTLMTRATVFEVDGRIAQASDLREIASTYASMALAGAILQQAHVIPATVYPRAS